MVATPTAISRLPDGGRFVALDSWRGLAALGVAAYHINGGGPLFDGPPTTRLNFGVDFFFVLSGFVLAAAYGERLAKGFPVGRYLLLRLGRVYPLHLVMVLAYVVMELVFLWLQPGNVVGRAPFTGDRDPWLIVSSLTLVGPWFSPPLPTYNMQSWSIAVEVWLYLALALSLRLGSRWGWWPLPVLALVGLPITGLAVWPDYLPPQMLRGVVGFGLGVATWRLRAMLRGRIAPPGAAIAHFAELAIVVAVAAVLTFGDDSDPLSPVLYVLFAILVLIFAGDRGIVSRLLHGRVFVWLGVLSYSFYMVHGIVLGRIMDALRLAGVVPFLADETKLDALAPDPWLSSLIGCAMIAACVPFAWLAWRLVEAPAREWSRRRAAEMGVEREEAGAPTI